MMILNENIDGQTFFLRFKSFKILSFQLIKLINLLKMVLLVWNSLIVKEKIRLGFNNNNKQIILIDLHYFVKAMD